MGSTKVVPWSHGVGCTTGGMAAGDWFGGRREYFVRQVLSDSLHLITWFQQLYDRYIEGCLHQKVAEGTVPDQERHAVQTELLQQFTVMVGTERDTGPLWQLKDLCHQIWPHSQEEEHFHGVLFDWLTGSLFHECMKLKENLYLLNNYGARTTTVDTLVEQMGLHQRDRTGVSLVEDVRMLIGQITGDVSRQMERVGFLFGQVNYLLRLMLPALIENRLVVRLLVEKEEVLTELWGESLDELFAGIFTGGAAAGFCLAAENFFVGQWYEQALRLYERALACDRCCHEAFVRVAQLHAILGKDQGES
ncbi:hypothetical protein [uncultured Desulfobulbus sp.]|uniref:hypothetical protein n=1 Tax=uncultured Desulfobulbus sp. TaxID=239745 RepID=UPI0029C746B3|nr:hypothetical protein [uncultured Desulfobulbus sp.]